MATQGPGQAQAQGQTPEAILTRAFHRATASLSASLVRPPEIQQRVEYVGRNLQNRAGVRLLMACLVAKAHNPGVDVRKPYTEIGAPDAYSGRTYDERYVAPFITAHNLPCNPTTAFLTPALRNRNVTLTPDVNLVGRPPRVYADTLQLLTDVHEGRVAAEELLAEVVRTLINLRDEQQQRMNLLLAQLQVGEGAVPLSAARIVTLIQQHLASPNSSRLLVLIVAAAYQAASANLGERALPLYRHTAADRQTGALGDLEITLTSDDEIVTSYEMKDKHVTREDLDIALAKVTRFHHERGARIDDYIFITTDTIDPDVAAYAASLYEKTGGIEFAILDCIGFLRHFLYLFHRLRMQFVEAYQALVLAEPESAVSQPLKELFLTLRRAAESQLAEG